MTNEPDARYGLATNYMEMRRRCEQLETYLRKLLWGADHWGTPNVPVEIRAEGHALLGDADDDD